jgi:hypothetical protein
MPSIELIQVVVHDTAVKKATLSLFAWSIINLAAWIVLESETRQFLLRLRNPNDDIYILAYGGAFIGGLMLFFSLIGTFAKGSMIGFLNGISLLGVGIWNISHDFFAIGALKTYGYTISINNLSGTWIMLGTCQIIWGCRQIGKFSRLSSGLTNFDRVEKQQGYHSLRIFMNSQTGLQLSVTRKTLVPVLNKTEHYSTHLLPERAIAIEKTLNDLFVIEKSTASQWEFRKGNIAHLIDNKGQRWKVSLEAYPFNALKSWASEEETSISHETEPVIPAAELEATQRRAESEATLHDHTEEVLALREQQENTTLNVSSQSSTVTNVFIQLTGILFLILGFITFSSNESFDYGIYVIATIMIALGTGSILTVIFLKKEQKRK